jgi:competence protein ComFB
MEDLVEELYEEMYQGFDCCHCEQCHADIVAYTLNQLPGKYVVTKAGGAISKADSLRFQHITDIRAAMVRAVQVVKDYPRH